MKRHRDQRQGDAERHKIGVGWERFSKTEKEMQRPRRQDIEIGRTGSQRNREMETGGETQGPLIRGKAEGRWRDRGSHVKQGEERHKPLCGGGERIQKLRFGRGAIGRRKTKWEESCKGGGHRVGEERLLSPGTEAGAAQPGGDQKGKGKEGEGKGGKGVGRAENRRA